MSTPAPPTRSQLITWLFWSFGVCQALLILNILTTIFLGLQHVNSLLLFWLGSVLDHVALVPVLLGIITLMLYRTHHYHRAARRLSWLAIVHYVIRLFLLFVYMIGMFVCFLASGFKLQNATNPIAELVAAMGKATAAHPVLFTTILTVILVVDGFFTVLWLGVGRSLRAIHFAPPAAETAVATPPVAAPTEARS